MPYIKGDNSLRADLAQLFRPAKPQHYPPGLSLPQSATLEHPLGVPIPQQQMSHSQQSRNMLNSLTGVGLSVPRKNSAPIPVESGGGAFSAFSPAHLSSSNLSLSPDKWTPKNRALDISADNTAAGSKIVLGRTRGNTGEKGLAPKLPPINVTGASPKQQSPLASPLSTSPHAQSLIMQTTELFTTKPRPPTPIRKISNEDIELTASTTGQRRGSQDDSVIPSKYQQEQQHQHQQEVVGTKREQKLYKFFGEKFDVGEVMFTERVRSSCVGSFMQPAHPELAAQPGNVRVDKVSKFFGQRVHLDVLHNDETRRGSSHNSTLRRSAVASGEEEEQSEEGEKMRDKRSRHKLRRTLGEWVNPDEARTYSAIAAQPRNVATPKLARIFGEHAPIVFAGESPPKSRQTRTVSNIFGEQFKPDLEENRNSVSEFRLQRRFAELADFDRTPEGEAGKEEEEGDYSEDNLAYRRNSLTGFKTRRKLHVFFGERFDVDEAKKLLGANIDIGREREELLRSPEKNEIDLNSTSTVIPLDEENSFRPTLVNLATL